MVGRSWKLSVTGGLGNSSLDADRLCGSFGGGEHRIYRPSRTLRRFLESVSNCTFQDSLEWHPTFG